MCLDDLYLQDYKLHVVVAGKGKGIATYYKENIFAPVTDIKEQNFQLSKFKSSQCDIISLYRSADSSYGEITENLSQLINRRRATLIIGDFNFCYINSSQNVLKDFLHLLDFKQIIKAPTHIEGNLIDHAYIRDFNGTLKAKHFLHSKYYSDHKGLAVILGKGEAHL